MGTYEVIARQTDAAENQSANSSLITVTIDKTVPDAPTVSNITTGSYNTDQSFTLSGESGATLEYSLDNGISWSTYSSEVSLSAEGTYEVIARQTDIAENQSSNSSLITVTMDKSVPNAPTVSGITTGSYNTDQSFTVSGESGATFEYSLDNGISWSTYSSTVSLSAEGTYEVIARQTDAAENQSANSSLITVIIDKTALDAPTVSGITTGSYNTDQSFTVSGESGATLEYSLDSGTSWSTYSSEVSLSAEGTYEVIARQTDAAENQSANSSLITVIIDKTGPVVTSITPSDGATDVDLETNLVIIFDESLDSNTKGTVSFGSTLTTFTDASNCSITFSTTVVSNDTVTINSDVDFAEGTAYSDITISGFKDLAGNEISYNDSNYDFTTLTSASVPDDYLARWRFENDYNDETGNYYATPVLGSPDFSITFYKEGSSSLEVNDVALMPDSELPLSTNSISISAFIYINNSAAGAIVLVDNEKIVVIYDADNSKLIAGFLASSAIVEIENIFIETWYHVLTTYDGNELILYINGGSETRSINGLADDVSGSSSICLGSSFGPNCWRGYIDDMIIYDRALSESEVSDIYNSY